MSKTVFRDCFAVSDTSLAKSVQNPAALLRPPCPAVSVLAVGLAAVRHGVRRGPGLPAEAAQAGDVRGPSWPSAREGVAPRSGLLQHIGASPGTDKQQNLLYVAEHT